MNTIPLGTRPCRHCGRPIAWVKVNATGKPMPIDPQQANDGNVYVSHSNGHLGAVVATRDGPRPPGIPFMPHFATCPVLNKRKPTEPTITKPPPPEQFTLDL